MKHGGTFSGEIRSFGRAHVEGRCLDYGTFTGEIRSFSRARVEGRFLDYGIGLCGLTTI